MKSDSVSTARVTLSAVTLGDGVPSRTFHEASSVFPLLEGEDFDALVADIRTHGLREPISLHPDGSILDGRNRYLACREAKIEPRYEEWEGPSAIEFVISMNLRRRHLAQSQRATLAVEILPMLELEAARRMKARQRT